MARQRSSTKLLLRRLGATRRAIYVLDDRRRFVYCNAACAKWLARDPEDLRGQRRDYHSQTEGGDLSLAAAGLCPPPEVFAGKRMRGVVRATSPGGEVSRRRADFLPLPGADDSFAGAIVIVEDQEYADADGAADDGSPAALHERLAAFRRRLAARHRLARFAGESPAARRARAQASLAQESMSRVVIVGPQDSGREYLAKAIHYGRAANPGWLAPVDGRLVDAELLQLAVTDFKRRSTESGLERSSSLLILNVDELSPTAQDELAGFLDLPGFELHTLATASRPLGALAEQGRFRRDLALELLTLAIELTPLRERSEDIPLLAQYFLEELNAAGGRQLSGFSEEALDRLYGYHWPGDVGELSRVVQEVCQAAHGQLVQETDLPDRLRLAAEASAQTARIEAPIDLDAFLSSVEQELIRRALEQTKGNKAKAARLLGVTRQRIIKRLAEAGRPAQGDADASEPDEDEES